MSRATERGRATDARLVVAAEPSNRRPVRVALHLRASTVKKACTVDGEEYRQRPEIQEQRLRDLAVHRGWPVVAVYCDRASGRKDNRPELQRLMADALGRLGGQKGGKARAEKLSARKRKEIDKKAARVATPRSLPSSAKSETLCGEGYGEYDTDRVESERRY